MTFLCLGSLTCKRGLHDDSSSLKGHELGTELCRGQISVLVEEAGPCGKSLWYMLAEGLSKAQADHVNTLLIIQDFLHLQVSVPHSG